MRGQSMRVVGNIQHVFDTTRQHKHATNFRHPNSLKIGLVQDNNMSAEIVVVCHSWAICQDCWKVSKQCRFCVGNDPASY